MTLDAGQATQLLARIRGGDADAREELLPLLYKELKAVAASCMGRDRGSHTLQPTALVHEAWMRIEKGLEGNDAPGWNDRRHFVRVAAIAMRHVLVDHARKRYAQKRDHVEDDLPLDEVIASFDEKQLDVVELADALEKLGEDDPELASLVDLRFFAGLSIAETAKVMGVSTPTVERRWRVARMWLRRELPLA